jgi:aerotaxis receptor
VKNRCKNGDYYWVHAYVSPIYEEDSLVGYQSVRYPPSREQIKRAERLYRLINKRGGRPGFLGSLQLRFNHAHLVFATISAVTLSGIGFGLLSGQLAPINGLLATLAGLAAAFGLAYFTTRPLARLREVGKTYADNDLMEFVYSGSGQEAASVEHALLMQQSKLNTVVGRLNHFSQFLLDAAQKSANTAEHSHNNMQKMGTEVESVATAITEMNATIEEIARNANITAEKTHATKTDVQEGNRALDSTSKEIGDLGNQVEHTSEVIDQLSTDFRSVDTVLRFIEDISEQTNLLALNAAIEAARAGDQGRGFAVVADQVRLLANQTKESTNNIKSLLNKLDNDIGTVRDDIGRSREQMHQVLERISSLSGDLERIEGSVVNVTDLNSSIANAVEEQHSVVDEITRNIHNINEISDQSAQDAEHSSTAAAELKDTAKSLEILVRQVGS